MAAIASDRIDDRPRVADAAADAEAARFREAPWRALSRIKVSFRSGMIGISLLFVAGGALSAHLPWLWISHENVELLAREINAQVIASTNREVDDLFQTATQSATALETMIEGGVADPGDADRLEQAMLAVLRAHRDFSIVSVGLPSGDLVFAQRINQHELAVGRTHWDKARKVAAWTEKRYALSKDGVFYIRTLAFEDDTDATLRPWYLGAAATPGKPFWSKVTRLFSGRLGLTGAIAMKRDGQLTGVVAIAIGLGRLSDYLNSVDLGPDSAAFIIDRSGSLVAFSDPGEDLAPAEGGLKTISASFHPKLMLASAALKASGTALAAIHAPLELAGSDGQGRYFVTVSPDGRPDWLVGTVIPESKFLGPIERNQKHLILGGIAMLALVGLAAAFIARVLFIAPLMQMIEETHFIERFAVEAVQPVRTVIRELDRLSRALVRMAAGLGSFRRFLPADLVQELMQQGFAAEVGGERRTVSVLFMDVQNFTTLTERMGHRILPILGDYLSDMTAALIEHRATIDKFIGDAVMAFWGAPRFNEEHAADACRAALLCARRMEERRRAWAAEGKPQLQIRIGVNSGRVVVGNIGSRDRLDYTVIGDAVNLASRLEGLNKVYGTGIIIGAATYELAKYDIVARRLDHVNVKGKEETVAVYELLAMAEEDGAGAPPWVAVYERGLDLYLSGDTAAARARFAETIALRGDDAPSRHFLKLCDERLAKAA